MVYQYQYTLTAIAASVVLIILNIQRRSYSTARNHIFASLLYSNLLAAIVDALCYSTVETPERYSLSVLYGANMVYLALFGAVAGNFLRYVAALTDDRRIISHAGRLMAGMVGVEVALLLTTPVTHWFIYFDEALVYRHGPLFGVMYVLPITLIAGSVVLLLGKGHSLSRFQRVTVLSAFVLFLAFAAFQIADPAVDLFHMICVLAIYTIYIVFENPAYYTYHATRCLNAAAFYAEASSLAERNIDRRLLLVCVDDRERDHGLREEMLRVGTMEAAADKLFGEFGRRVYCLRHGRILILLDDRMTEAQARERVERVFARGIRVRHERRRPEVRVRGFRLNEVHVSEDYVDHLIEIVQHAPTETLCSETDLAKLVYQQHLDRETEDALLRAVRDDSFYMVYQPIYDIRRGSYHSMEALVRMNDAEGKPVSPDRFIPIAEQDRAILPIGLMTLEKVCRLWNERDLASLGIEYVEVNLSPVQLLEPGMARQLIAVPEKAHVSPEHINL